MELFLRAVRSLLIAALGYLCLRYLQFQEASVYVAGGIFVVGILSYFVKWAAVTVGVLVIWSAAHFVFGAPTVDKLGKETNIKIGSSASYERSSARTLSARLLDLKNARELGLITDQEYVDLRKDVLSDEKSQD